MGQRAVIFGCAGLELTAREKLFFRDAQPWGFILFARNLETPDQIRALTASLRDTVGRNAPILIDQEGGRVARLRAPHWREWLPPLDQSAAIGPRDTPRAMWLRYRVIAAELLALGIDVNCAPMADIPSATVHPIIRDRCYGLEVDAVVAAGRAVASGLLDGGVLPVLKHIPGHGRPTADSHQELPVTNAPLAALQDVDFKAFKGLNDLPLGMTAHVIYSAIDPNNCATLSAKVIAMIRQDIGFDGLLMTDDISMSALSGTLKSRSEAALAVGCDMILHCNGDADEMADIASVTGTLTGAAKTRADAALGWRKPASAVDMDTLLAELDGLAMVSAHE